MSLYVLSSAVSRWRLRGWLLQLLLSLVARLFLLAVRGFSFWRTLGGMITFAEGGGGLKGGEGSTLRATPMRPMWLSRGLPGSRVTGRPW